MACASSATALLDDLRQGRALIVVQQRRLARSLAVDQPIGAARVETHHPVTHNLHRDAAEPGSICTRATIIDRRKRQETPRLAGILRFWPEDAACQLYYARSKHIVDEARLAHEQLGEMLERPSGVIRVSLPVDLGTLYLTPIIVDFARHYPAITFEFDLTPRRVDLVTEPFDMAIRIGKLEDSGLIARLIGRHSRYLYASPGYYRGMGRARGAR